MIGITVDTDLLLWVYFALTFVLILAFIILCARKPKIQVFPDGIYIKDFLYPSMIPNDSIKSIKLVHTLPKTLWKSNGYGGLQMWKGFFRIKDYRKRAVYYLENHFKKAYIEIQTTQSLYFINLKNEILTTQLFDEMKSTVKLVDESELVDMRIASQKRSIVIVVVFIAVLLMLTLVLPLL